MGERTAISWTDHTFNPWWGCVRVSDGCTNCYAETFAKRTGHGVWGPAKTTPRRLFGERHWAEPLAWQAQAEADGRRHRVFCASMADVFEAHPQLDEQRARLWELIGRTPALDWQLLTKRPENVPAMAPWGEIWPDNVWLGTSVEHQLAAEARIPRLLEVPAAVRFLSCEPLLGPVDLSRWLCGGCLEQLRVGHFVRHTCTEAPIDWVIVGGESGPNFRPMHLDWARSLRNQCNAGGMAFLFKQAGGRLPGRGTELDGIEWHEFPRTRELVTA